MSSMEQTLIILKPDSVQRGLVGDIIGRFEKAGLKLVAAKMVKAPKGLADKHYPKNRKQFISGLGERTITSYKLNGLDPMDQFKTNDSYKIGLFIQRWLVNNLTEGPVIAVVLEGPHAFELIRKICGKTLPLEAEPGTIRGDYSFDSPALANYEKRAIRNLIHASGDKKEATFEIGLWFSKAELHAYENVH